MKLKKRLSKSNITGDNTDQSTGRSTLILSVMIFLVIVFTCELILRSGWFQSFYRVPYMVGGYDSVEEQFHLLDEYIDENENVDCIFIGSSIAAVGVNPQTFEETYRERTGEDIDCFNFSVSAGTFSTFEVLARVISEDYHPHLMVFTIASRAFSELSNEIEDDFVRTPWAQYRSGQFNLQGWAEDKLYTVRYLNILSQLLFEKPSDIDLEDDVTASRFVNENSRTVQGYTPLLNYLDGAPIYWIQDGLTYTKKEINKPFVISSDDMEGYQNIVSMAKDGAFDALFVEMPSPNYFFLDEENAPQPSARSVMEQVAAYAWNEGIPFWLTDEDALLSPEQFADSKHFYISGSLFFSDWLGFEVAEMTESGFWEGNTQTAFIERPPSTDYLPQKSYELKHGMSSDTLRQCQRYIESFILVPDEKVVLDLRKTGLSMDERQTILGFFLEWNDQLDDTTYNDYLDLYALQNMADEPIDSLTFEQQNLLQQWHTSHHSDDLKSIGIDYILYTERWYDDSTSPDENLNDATQYRLVKRWDFSPLRESYYLMQIQ